jgi:hypothetical protein
MGGFFMQALIDRYGASRVARYGYGLLAALLVLFTILHCLNAVYYSFRGERLRLVSAGEDAVVLRDGQGRDLTMETPHGPIGTWGDFSITYAGQRISGAMDENTFDYVYHFSDGSSAPMPMVTASFVGQTESDDPLSEFSALQREEVALVERLQSLMDGGNPIPSQIGWGVLGLLLLLLGVGMICYPEKFWRMQTALTVDGGEPTDFALFGNRASGVLFLIFAFILPLAH